MQQHVVLLGNLKLPQLIPDLLIQQKLCHQIHSASAFGLARPPKKSIGCIKDKALDLLFEFFGNKEGTQCLHLKGTSKLPIFKMLC